MMHTVYKKGFTLIELLVVIAIIGILAGIVLASLGNARSGAKDSAVQEQMQAARSQAELFYTSNSSSYDNVCSSTGGTNNINALLQASATGNALSGVTVVTTDATAGAYNVVTCHDTATGWAAEAPLNGSSASASSMWCVDSTGFSGKKTGTTATSIGASSDVTC